MSTFRTSLYRWSSAPKFICEPLPDILEDVDGHDVHKGEAEEPAEEREVGADVRDAGHPETVAALGEKVAGSEVTREVGHSESHRVRPLHI